jgi:Fungal specific transcription factor domain
MHHLGTLTQIAASCYPHPGLKRLISSVIPTMAFQSESDTYLMDAALAMAALHLGNSSPEGHTLTRVAPHYFTLALAGYNKSLLQLNEANSGQLFLASAVIALYASLSRRTLFAEQYSVPIVWFWTFRGVRAVATAAWPWIKDSELSLFTDNMEPTLEPLPEEDVLCTKLCHRLQLDKCSVQDADAYLHAIKLLEWAQSSERKGDRDHIIRRKLMKFPLLVPFRFIAPLLSESDPRALIITAYYFAMLKNTDKVWWLQKMPEHEVIGLASIIPPEWAWGLEWPLSVIGATKVGTESPDSNPATSPSQSHVAFVVQNPQRRPEPLRSPSFD